MAHWTRLARVADCPPGRSQECIVEGRVVALYNVGGAFHALDGICPHQGGPLGQGELTGAIVTCPWHGWQFDVCTGQSQLNPQMKQPRYEVRVEDDWILVNLGA